MTRQVRQDLQIEDVVRRVTESFQLVVRVAHNSDKLYLAIRNRGLAS
jgi:hypothetical protein